MKSFQFFSFVSLPLALVTATPLGTKRQQVSCPPGFRNAVFNTNMPGQGDVSNRWNTISSHGVSNWIGFTINPLSQSPTYGNPAVSGAVDAAQIRIAMDPQDVPAAKALVTSVNPPTYLELFNEPDYSYMGYTPVTRALDAAASLNDLIHTPTRTQFISPAVAFTGSNYLSDFFANCPGCIDRIPIISLHVYKPNPQEAINQIIGVHNSYPSKRLWITELAPACDPSMGCTLDQGGVIGWMQTVVTWAAASGYVDKIFWNCGEWGPVHKDNPAQCNPSLTNPDGSATALLNAYSQVYLFLSRAPTIVTVNEDKRRKSKRRGKSEEEVEVVCSGFGSDSSSGTSTGLPSWNSTLPGLLKR